uniref:Uncharacterized protein n=1 Tax=Rhizophora mucronata TaxID=61149 RepID=A0A2P2K8W0_RHIMU
MPSKHCIKTFGQVHVSAGKKHAKEMCEKYLELYPAPKLMSHK